MNTELSTTLQTDDRPPIAFGSKRQSHVFRSIASREKGAVTIDLQRLNEAGVADFKWEVTYNSKHGQPGPLAYKVDTLVINRLLDQLGGHCRNLSESAPSAKSADP